MVCLMHDIRYNQVQRLKIEKTFAGKTKNFTNSTIIKNTYNTGYLQPSDHGFRKMLLLTNCEVHTAKYSERSFKVRTERNIVRTKT